MEKLNSTKPWRSRLVIRTQQPGFPFALPDRCGLISRTLLTLDNSLLGGLDISVDSVRANYQLAL